MSRLVRLVLVAVSLALAPLLFFHAQGNASSPSGPLLATNGFNLAELSRAGLRLQQENGTTTLGVEPASLELARQAFVREPLATSALFVLAVDERANGGNGGQDLLDAAAALDKRNRFLGAMQMEQFSRQGDLTRTFAVLDRLARVYPDLTDEFVQPLVLGLRQDDAIEVIAAALESEPVWAKDFWGAVPSDPVLAGRMLDLRRRTSRGTNADTDAKLMSSLALSGRFNDAFAFRDSLSGGAPEGSGFVAVGGHAPFGWDVETSGERSMTPHGESGYDIFVQQGTRGELGRQLLRLAPGRYTLKVNVTPVSAGNSLFARLQCATADATVSADQDLSGDSVFTVPASCRIWWLELRGDAWQMRDGLRASLTDMTFEAVQ